MAKGWKVIRLGGWCRKHDRFSVYCPNFEGCWEKDVEARVQVQVKGKRRRQDTARDPDRLPRMPQGAGKRGKRDRIA